MKHPERITAIVTQNGNTYLEGVSEAFAPVQAYWKEPNKANRDALRGFLTPETTLFQYTHGVADPNLVSPDGRNLDDLYLSRPGNDEIQLDLLLDYQSNVALYETIQTYLRKHQPPVLASMGKERSVLHSAGRGGVQARRCVRRYPLLRHRPFRARNSRQGNCRGHARIPRKAYRRTLHPNRLRLGSADPQP